ncbi:MAG TPA: UDP-glucose 4-epimerase GalE [Terriglobia bacterium]|nr:UDP-glucose 4-epimerase GalE [Terriglobia bacterium]
MQGTVIVTGGAGYIGSHVCKALHQRGILPVTIDDLSSGNDWAVKWGPLHVVNICDGAALRSIFDRYQVDAVLHFAAHSQVGESVSNPLKYHRNNIGGTVSLAEVMVERDVRRLVFSSTCAVYGLPETTPITEDAPRRPVNPYGQSKMAAENALMDVAATGKLSVAMLRYFNAAGADTGLEIGEAHEPESHIIPLAIRAATGRLAQFRLFGTDYPTPDGTCLRDYIHVNDLASAHLAALDFLQDKGGSHSFNLGTGKAVSVREILTAVEGVTGRLVPTAEVERRAGDPPILFAANGKARDQLNWEPGESDIDSIVRSAVAWDQVYHQQHQQAVPKSA